MKTIKASIIKSILQTAVVLILMQASLPAGAQVKFYTLVSEQTIFYDQTFQVQYVVEGSKNISQLVMPQFRDFVLHDVFEIPHTSTIDPQTLQLIDTYSRIAILSPRRNGRFTIPGASAIIDGKKFRSNAVKIEVRRNNLSTLSGDDVLKDAEGVDLQTEIWPGESVEEKVNKNLFLKVELNKTNCYVGEPLMAVYKLYSRLNATSQVLKRPSFTGFSVLEMVDAYDSKPETEIVNGIPYYVNIIRKVQLFPLQEGVFFLDAAEVESRIRFVRISESGDKKNDLRSLLNRPGDRFTSSRTPFEQRILLRTQPLPVTVNALPTLHQPDSFTGAIGKFTINAHTPATQLSQGDLAKISIVISGSGNIPLITLPAIQWPGGVDTAEPRVIEDINKYVYPLYGSKTFEFSFIPADTGRIVIPPVRFPFYDHYQHVYKIATTKTIEMHIGPAVARNATEIPSSESNQGNNSPIPRQLYWFALLAAVIVGCIIYQSWHLRKSRAKGNDEYVQLKEKREELPVDILAVPKLALGEGNSILFYESMQEALWNVIMVKYDVLPSQLNKHHVTLALYKKGVEKETINTLLDILQECEWNLYAPGQASMEPGKLLMKSEALLAKL